MEIKWGISVCIERKFEALNPKIFPFEYFKSGKI